jgi:ABC-type uncharacterized transport system permease subunit
MSNNNPYESPEPVVDDSSDASESPATSKATYKVLSDTVIGLNVRKSDNAFQALFVLASMVVCAALAVVLTMLNADWKIPFYGAVILGAFAGLVIGFFASGIYLMLYRAIRHAKGKHD